MISGSDLCLARRLAWTGLATAVAMWVLFGVSLLFTQPHQGRTQAFALLGLALVATSTLTGVAAVVLGLRARPRDRVALGVAAAALFLVAPFAALSVLLSGDLHV